MLLISEILIGYAILYRLVKKAHSGGILLYIRENILSKLLISDLSGATFIVEMKLRKMKWLLYSSYGSEKNLITNHYKCDGRTLDSQLGQYENFYASKMTVKTTVAKI